MKTNKSKYRTPLTIALALLFSSASILFSGCSLEQEYMIRRDLSGELTFNLEMEDLFITAMEDLMLFSSPEVQQDTPEFPSTDLVRKQWETIQNSEITHLNKPDRNHMTGRADFQNLNTFFSPESGFTGTSALRITTRGRLTRVEFYLSRDNYASIAAATPILREPAFEMFGPAGSTEDTSADEYFEMIETLLGEEGPQALRDSQMTLIIKTEGPIVNWEGAEKRSNREVVYTRPLLDFLLLKEPLQFSLEFE